MCKTTSFKRLPFFLKFRAKSNYAKQIETEGAIVLRTSPYMLQVMYELLSLEIKSPSTLILVPLYKSSYYLWNCMSWKTIVCWNENCSDFQNKTGFAVKQQFSFWKKKKKKTKPILSTHPETILTYKIWTHSGKKKCRTKTKENYFLIQIHSKFAFGF